MTFLNTAVVLMGWGVGHTIGKHLFSQMIAGRRERREARMKNITPKSPPKGGLSISED